MNVQHASLPPMRASKAFRRSHISGRRLNAAKGAASEAKVLSDLGATKNTEAVVGTEGKSIPDFQTSKTVGEIKDVKTVSNTKQLRIQKEAAQQSGDNMSCIQGLKHMSRHPLLRGPT